MHHAVTHSLIGLGVVLFTTAFGAPLFGATVATGFYFFREVYQYYLLDKTHCDFTGCFDHMGWVPVLITSYSFALVIKYLIYIYK